MAEIKNGNCSCCDCSKKRQNEQRHLQHPFYKKVEDVTAEVAKEQILKGAAKYPEPFNPDSWTNVELVQHQLQELRDAQVYSVGLLDRLEKQEKAYNNLLKDYEIAKQEAEFWRLRAIKEKGQAIIAMPDISITAGTPNNKKLFDEIKKALGENLDAKG